MGSLLNCQFPAFFLFGSEKNKPTRLHKLNSIEFDLFTLKWIAELALDRLII